MDCHLYSVLNISIKGAKIMIKDIPRDELDNLLFKAMRAVYRFERTKVEQFGLTYEGIYILQFLRRQSPSHMGKIAKEMKIPISTATRTVDRLQNKKFLSRRKDPVDKRSILVSLEPAGEKIVEEVEEHTFKILLNNLTSINDDDLAAFIRTAEKLEVVLNVDEETLK